MAENLYGFSQSFLALMVLRVKRRITIHPKIEEGRRSTDVHQVNEAGGPPDTGDGVAKTPKPLNRSRWRYALPSEILPLAAAETDIVSDGFEDSNHLLVEMTSVHCKTLAFALCKQICDVAGHVRPPGL